MTVDWIDAPGEWYNDVQGVWSQTDSVVPTFGSDTRRFMAMPPIGFVRRYVSSPSSDFVIHASVNFQGSTGNSQIFRALDGAAHHIWIERVNTSGLLRVHGPAGVLATGATVTSTGTWYWLSFGGHIADSGGTYELKINGTTEVSGSGVDTRNGSTGTAQKLQLGNENAGVTGTPNWYVRDVIMLTGTTTHLSQRRVAYIQPNRAGHDAEWTPSAGSNWQNVDDRDGAPDDGSTYNSEATINDQDLYALAPLPSSALSILAVSEIARFGKTTNTHQLVKRLLRTNNNEYSSSDFGIPLGYQWSTGGVRETNPQTTAAWTENEVNRLQTGALKSS